MHESRSAHGVLDGLAALVRRWRIVVPFAVVTPIVVFVLTAPTPAVYEASADVLLDRKGQAISGLREVEWWEFDAARAVRTQAELARLPDVKRLAVAAAEDRGLPAGSLVGASDVTEDGLTDIMTFGVRDGDPEVAIALATIYAEQYVAHRRALETTAIRRAIGVVSDQLANARARGVPPDSYADLVRQLQRLHAGLATVAGNVQLVRPARTAARVEHTLWRDTLMALVLGLVTGIGLAGLAGLVDPRARSVEEISDQLGLPVLGRLPLQRRGARTSVATALLRGEDDEGAEAIRMLRIALESVAGSQRIVMVTSSVAGEGKSTTAASLAVSLALAGRDVVLVDLDLRRPDLWRIFDLPKSPGIVELARGVAREADAAHGISLLTPTAGSALADSGSAPDTRGSLRVVPAGNALAVNTESIVVGGSLRPVLEALTTSADLVLVDGPPALQSADALALGSGVVDGFVLVAQTRRYRRRYAAELERFLARSSATALGLVVLGTRQELEPARGAYAPVREPRAGLHGLGHA